MFNANVVVVTTTCIFTPRRASYITQGAKIFTPVFVVYHWIFTWWQATFGMLFYIIAAFKTLMNFDYSDFRWVTLCFLCNISIIWCRQTRISITFTIVSNMLADKRISRNMWKVEIQFLTDSRIDTTSAVFVHIRYSGVYRLIFPVPALSVCRASASSRDSILCFFSFYSLASRLKTHTNINRAPSSEFVSSSIPSWQILTAHAQPFRGARDLAFCLKVPFGSLLVWASSGGSGETARMRRLAWAFAARIGDKYQIRLTRPNSLPWDYGIICFLNFRY